MEFTLKDLVYISIYVASVAGLFMKFRDRVQANERIMRSISKIIFLERGGLNVINKDTCDQHRSNTQQNINGAMAQIHCVNQNVVKIMLEMKLEPIVMEVGLTNK